MLLSEIPCHEILVDFVPLFSLLLCLFSFLLSPLLLLLRGGVVVGVLTRLSLLAACGWLGGAWGWYMTGSYVFFVSGCTNLNI